MGDAVVVKAFQGMAVDLFAADHDGDGGGAAQGGGSQGAAQTLGGGERLHGAEHGLPGRADPLSRREGRGRGQDGGFPGDGQQGCFQSI